MSTRSGPAMMRERRRWSRDVQSPVPSSLPTPALRPLFFSTRSLPPEQQFEAWLAHTAPVVDVLLPDGASPADGFPADHSTWNLGNILIVQEQAPAHRYIRSAAKLRSSPIDHWSLTARRTGSAWTEVDGQVAHGEQGTIEFRSLGYPFRGRATDSASTVAYMPRDLFADVAPNLDAKNNSAIAGHVADLCIDYLGSVEARLPGLGADDVPVVVHSVRDLVVACILSANHHAPSEHLRDIALMERARRHIQQNMGSADLTPASICRAIGVSRSHLYQLFEANGGVLHYIQKRRLMAAHAALSNPTDDRYIVEIAEAIGFNSAANFSRAFSHEFGYSPREARNVEAWTPAAVACQDDEGSFEAWLRKLGR